MQVNAILITHFEENKVMRIVTAVKNVKVVFVFKKSLNALALFVQFRSSKTIIVPLQIRPRRLSQFCHACMAL